MNEVGEDNLSSAALLTTFEWHVHCGGKVFYLFEGSPVPPETAFVKMKSSQRIVVEEYCCLCDIRTYA